MSDTKPAKTRKKAAPAEAKPPGRPSIYSQELANRICDRIADGESMRSICREEGMPDKRTMLRWLNANAEFRTQYAHAREEQADNLVEEILDIADDGWNDTYLDDEGNKRTDHDVIARSRLRVDARKWIAAKLAPKKYGDKLAIGGADDLPPIKGMSDEELEAKIAALAAAANHDGGE